MSREIYIKRPKRIEIHDEDSNQFSSVDIDIDYDGNAVFTIEEGFGVKIKILGDEW